MYDYDYDEPYWGPSEADELFDEFKSKLIDSAKSSLKYDMEALRSENASLRKRNKELEDKIYEVEQKERHLDWKANDLKREVEKEFYATHVKDVMDEWLDNYQVWYAESIGHEQPKCDKCNEDRQWVLTWPDGTTTSKKCECSYLTYSYEPRISEANRARYHKTKVKEWGDKCHVYITKSYEPAKAHADAHDCYCEFRIGKIFDEFNDDVKEYSNKIRYGERIGFETKEECQKYCDWLNEKRKEQDT